MGVFFDNVGAGDSYKNHLGSSPLAWEHVAAGSQIAALVGMSYIVKNSELIDLDRTVTYGGQGMESLGAIAWNNTGDGFTELFALQVDAGKAPIRATIVGDPLHFRTARASSLSYNGVGAISTVATASGTGTGLTQSTNTVAANKIVQVYGTAAGLTGFTKTQRYLNAANVALLMGDAAGTGSGQAVAATRTPTGAWSGISVILDAADIIGSGKLVTVRPEMSGAGRRLSRPGVTRREVFIA